MNEEPLIVPIGAQFYEVFQLKDENGAVVPITGFSGRGEVLPTNTGGTAVFALTVTPIDEANGKVRVLVLGATTSALSPKVLWGYAEVYSGPTIYRFFSGRVELRAKGGAS
jgi:hypothetical protein